MLQSLRARLALSHMLPVLILVPLLGLALLYRIERSYFWDDLATELAVQGELIARLAGEAPGFWQDPESAHRVWKRISVSTPSAVMLLDGEGRLLSTTQPEAVARAEVAGDQDLVRQALDRGVVWRLEESPTTGAELLVVHVRVQDDAGRTRGIVRISHPVADLRAQLWLLRGTILTTLLAGGLVSLAAGLLLARSLSQPLVELTGAVANLRLDETPSPVAEQGPGEIRSLARTFNRMSGRLFELESTRRQLLSGIVHELGRPLGSIKAAAQTIYRTDDRALNVELAQSIDQHVDQLRFQLEDLAQLGQLERWGIELAPEPTDLAAMVRMLCRQHRLAAGDKQIDLQCEGMPDELVIQADPLRVSQILGNLLDNAIKYTPAGGRVQVTARNSQSRDTPMAVVAVMDTGPGIPPAEQAAVFELFYRSPQQRIHEGLGIGLALSRWLAEAHGGTLTVTSEPGQGATFTLSLPVHAPQPGTPESPLMG